MQALAVEAGLASRAALASAPQAAGQRTLSCGYQALDDLTGGLARGQLTLLDASSPLLWDLTLGTLCQATREGPVVALDGGNSLDPYLVGAHARQLGLDPRRVLGGLRVARAFTAHQLSAMLEERLEGELRAHRPALVLASCLPELYLDEDVPWPEANALVGRAVELLRAAARDHGCAALATNAGVAKLAARPRMRNLLHGADRVLRLLQAGEATVLEDLPAGRRAVLRPPRRGQTTLADPRPPRAQPPGVAPAQLMARGAA